MDKKYQQIMIALDSNYTKSPNIINIWKIYLQTKRSHFIEELDKCEQMLHLIGHVDDIPSETILTLYLMRQFFLENNNIT
jgi:hypothetical protein